MGPFFSCSLWVGHNNDSLCQPIIWLFTPDASLCSPNSQFSLQFLNEPVLRVALIHNDRPHFTSQHSLSKHWMHIGGLFGATDNWLKLESRWYKEVWEAGVVSFTRKSMLGYKHKQNRSSTGSHIQVVKMLKHWLQKIPLSNHSIGLSGQSNLLAKLFTAFHSILYCQVYIKLLRHLWQGMLDSWSQNNTSLSQNACT